MASKIQQDFERLFAIRVITSTKNGLFESRKPNIQTERKLISKDGN